MNNSKTTRLSYTNRAQALVASMTLEEKVGCMSGDSDLDQLRESWRRTQNFSYHPYTIPGDARLGIPSLLFADGPHGVVMGHKSSTCFPASMCRGASFDEELEESIGKAIGEEMQAYGANLFGGVCVNLPYHPGWGRCQEVYSEDSFLMGQLGAALVRGVQSQDVIACVKHFAFNCMENSRLFVDVTCDERTEKEVFLPHFKKCIEAGAACVMAAFNKVRGDHCCENKHLLTEVLKEDWGFDGFVLSDFFSGIHNTKKAVEAGLDLEMPNPRYYGNALLKLVKEGSVPEQLIDEAVTRIVRTALAFTDSKKSRGKSYSNKQIGSKAHISLARRSAEEGITLLKNRSNLLPLSKNATKRIVVLGTLAKEENLGDFGSGRVFPPYSVSVLQGLCDALPYAQIIYYSGDNLEHAMRLAQDADAVVLVVGSGVEDEGEQMNASVSPDTSRKLGGDRSTIQLHAHDIALLEATGSVSNRTIAILVGGSSFLLDPWIEHISAVLMAYYPGMEGGHVLADILFGKVNPSGKLPFVIPRQEENLPSIDWMAKHQHFDYYHGYTKLDKDGVAPHFPFGFGLSYTSFSLSRPEFHLQRDEIAASCLVENTGSRAGTQVIQFYAGFDNSQLDRPKKVLRGFARVTLAPGEKKEVTVCCPLNELFYYDVDSNSFRLEHMVHQLYIGTSSADQDLLKGEIAL